MPNVLKITSIQCLQYLKTELSYQVDDVNADEHLNFEPLKKNWEGAV